MSQYEPSGQGAALPLESPAPARAGPGRGSSVRWLAARLGIAGLLVGVSLAGLPYYLAPIAERVRHPLHVWMKPSGYVGQAAGILSLLLFLFMWLYPLRKKLRRLANVGSLSRWLEVHIVAGLSLPLVGAIHAGWRFHGLIGLGYGSMLLVSLSGIVGRYLYTRIPRTRSGVELSLDQIEIKRRELIARIAAAMHLDPRAVEADLADDDLPRGRKVRALSRRWREQARNEDQVDEQALAEAVRLARRQVALAQQVRRLDATQRLFRLWHIAHRPIAITAFLAIVIHVAVVVILGVTWIW